MPREPAVTATESPGFTTRPKSSRSNADSTAAATSGNATTGNSRAKPATFKRHVGGTPTSNQVGRRKNGFPRAK
ncbi:MAG: hypothetical protein Kow0069_18370 [Promethearchaeota archaeon]